MGNQKGKLAWSNKPTCKLLEKIHQSVPNMDITEIRDHWELFNHQTKGKRVLAKKDFVDVYTNIFGNEAAELAEHIFKAFDLNSDGKVSFEEFLIGLSLTDGEFGITEKQRREKLAFFFGVYDADKNGAIDREELLGIVKAVYNLIVSTDETFELTPEEFADQLFEFADENKDGLISFIEFEKAMSYDPTLVHILLPCPQDAGE